MFCGKSKHAGTGNPIYGLGLIGTFVFYFQQTMSFSGFFVALFKAILWPAFMIFDLLSFLH